MNILGHRESHLTGVSRNNKIHAFQEKTDFLKTEETISFVLFGKSDQEIKIFGRTAKYSINGLEKY